MPSLSYRLQYEKIQRQEVRLTDAIDGSYTEPSEVLSATVVSSTQIRVDMIAHTRRYLDLTTVSLSSATLNSTAFGIELGIYYDDATRSSSAPTVLASTALTEAAHNYARGRHFVGKLTTPATTGDAPTSGGTSPPGGWSEFPFP